MKRPQNPAHPYRQTDPRNQFLKSRVGSEKILFGSNGLSWERYLQQWDELGLREDSARAMLVENPKRVFGL